jgi:hypothetical protein
MIETLVGVGEGIKSPGSTHLLDGEVDALGVRVTVGQRVSVGLKEKAGVFVTVEVAEAVGAVAVAAGVRVREERGVAVKVGNVTIGGTARRSTGVWVARLAAEPVSACEYK